MYKLYPRNPLLVGIKSFSSAVPLFSHIERGRVQYINGASIIYICAQDCRGRCEHDDRSRARAISIERYTMRSKRMICSRTAYLVAEELGCV